MEISQQSREGKLELQLKGRFDANWADHVGKAIEAAIRAGQHHIDLDFAQVNYLSSAGIRVLVKYFKQLSGVGGALRVLRPASGVLSTLQLSGMGDMLVAPESPEPGLKKDPQGQTAGRRWEANGVKFEAHELPGAAPLACTLHGFPERFAAGQLLAADSVRMRFGPEMIGLGLGAFGSGGEDARSRFGEFLAVAGAAVTQPTDGSSVPDFQVAQDQFVPEVNLLYGLTATGGFSRLLRFEAAESKRQVIGLSELVEALLGDLQAASVAFVILAESAAIVGATLRQSPAIAAGQSPWSFPAVRDWLSFTTERGDERNVVFIVGFVGREASGEWAAFLRPVGSGSSAQGHFHAAVFPYRPLPKDNLSLKEAVANLLGTETAQAVMHLLADEREFEGVGQTDLMRGACWVAPLTLPARAATNQKSS